jgi:hypothetical protein
MAMQLKWWLSAVWLALKIALLLYFMNSSTSFFAYQNF